MVFSLSTRNYGWMIVFIAFILNAIAFGTMASVSMFLKPLVHEFGWTRGSLSMGYTIMTLATSVSGVLWSILVDKYGSRWISRLGAFTIGIPLILLSNIESLADFYLYYFLFGAIGHATVTGPLYASVGLWFSRNVGLALGCTFAGSAVGQGVIPYIARYLIDGYGWQQAYLYLGIGYLIIAAPISLFLREAPSRSEFSGASNNQKKEGKEGPSNMAIVGWISFAVLFCCTAMSVVVVHLVPLLTDQGLTAKSAANVLLTLMIAGAFGRVLGGKLADTLGAIKSYALMSLTQTSVIFLFPFIDNLYLTYLVAIIFGVGFSGTMATFLVCVRVMVTPSVLAKSMSIVGMSGWIGMAFGGLQGGVLFDLTGTYYWSFAVGSIAGVINLIVIFSFNTYLQRYKQG